MKKVMFTGFIACAMVLSFGCETKKAEDSVEQAEEATEATMDSMATDTTKSAVTDDKMDQAEFIIHAASGGMMEVAMGKMAESQASHADVKAFGKMMVTDHTKANEELKTLAASKNVTLPTRVGEDHQEHIDKMADLKGTDFDREYMQLMVEDHEEDVEDFKEASQNNEYDAETKAFASKTLTTLQKHLERARQLHDMVKNTNGDKTTTTTTTTETKR
jgi:putative membrane protein